MWRIANGKFLLIVKLKNKKQVENFYPNVGRGVKKNEKLITYFIPAMFGAF